MEKKVKITAAVLVLFLNLFLFTAIFRSFFVSTASLNAVFEQAKTYHTVSKIAQERLKELIPETVQDDPLAFAALNYGINKFVTPELVGRLAMPVLNTAVRIAKAPTSIEGNNVVLDTTKYKANLTSSIGSYDLPQGVESAATQIVNSVPQEVKIIDLEKRPNSIVARIIRFRDTLHKIKNALWVFGIGALAGAVYLGYQRKENINNMVKTLSGTFAVSGLVTLGVSAVAALIYNNFNLYPVETIVDSMVNTLIVDLLNYYMRIAAQWGIVIAMVFGLVYFFTLEAVQKSIKKNYKKVKTTLTK